MNLNIFWYVLYIYRKTIQVVLTQDLHSRGGELGQVGKTASLGDEAGSHLVSDEAGQVGRHSFHLLVEIFCYLFPGGATKIHYWLDCKQT